MRPCVCRVITKLYARPQPSSRNSNFEADVLEIEICCARFDIRFEISIFELTKTARSGKKVPPWGSWWLLVNEIFSSVSVQSWKTRFRDNTVLNLSFSIRICNTDHDTITKIIRCQIQMALYVSRVQSEFIYIFNIYYSSFVPSTLFMALYNMA